ncbi:MAG: hypothetical protein ABH885_03455, partial [Candidatus Omnitrophota bacterium]
VLQDNGYTLLSTDYQGGIIRATTGNTPPSYKSPGQVTGLPGVIDILGLLGPSDDENDSDAVDITVTLERFTEEVTKMRIVLSQYYYDSNGRIISRRIDDPAVIQKYYGVIMKEIFMREQIDRM